MTVIQTVLSIALYFLIFFLFKDNLCSALPLVLVLERITDAGAAKKRRITE